LALRATEERPDVSADPPPSIVAPRFAPKRSAPELIDGAINLVRQHYPTLVTVSAIAFTPSLLMAPFAHLLPGFIPNLLNTFCAGYAEACLLLGLAAAYRGDQLPGVGPQLRGGRRVGWRVIGIAMIRSIATAIGFVLLIVPGLLAFAHYALGTPAAAIEDLTIGPALARGGALAKGEYGRIIGVFALTALVFLLLLFGVGALVGLLTQSESFLDLGTTVVQILVMPVFVAITVMLYFDIRERREGLDIEWALGVEAPSPSRG
jgi:hypothetical protein